MRKIIILIYVLFITNFITGQLPRIQSRQSLYIEMWSRNDKHISSATGFIIKPKKQYYLVTNWHVATGKNPINKMWEDTSNKIAPYYVKIFYNRYFERKEVVYAEQVIKDEILFDNKNKPIWHQDTLGKEMVDVVEIPLTDTNDVSIYPIDYKNKYDTIIVSPTSVAFAVGYPLGLSSVNELKLPIWKAGFISSEPTLNWNNEPLILFDVNGFPGMSGSPVYYIPKSFSTIRGGEYWYEISFILGVYSESIYQTEPNKNILFNKSVFGCLWKIDYLRPLFNKLP